MLIVNKGPSNFHMKSQGMNWYHPHDFSCNNVSMKSLLVANFFRHIKKKSTFPRILVIHNLNIWE